MELFGMFYHILRFLKLRSSCSFCFQMLGFLIRAKHCECSDILQIFVPHYLEESCRVMGRRRTTGAATLCCSGHFTSSPKLECVIEQNKNSDFYSRKHLFFDQINQKQVLLSSLILSPLSYSQQERNTFKSPSHQMLFQKCTKNILHAPLSKSENRNKPLLSWPTDCCFSVTLHSWHM